MKIAVVAKTLRIHDNPFLDANHTIWVEDYNHHQKAFFDSVLKLHLCDLAAAGVKPIIMRDLAPLRQYLATCASCQIYVDYQFGEVIPGAIFVPAWTLVNWSDRTELIREWFLPEALRNHDKFKAFAHANRRREFRSIAPIKPTIAPFRGDYTIANATSPIVPEVASLDAWIIKRLKSMKFMRNNRWYKPATSPRVTLEESSSQNALPQLAKTTHLSPFFAIGALSPLVAYNHWIGENRAGSPRDQLLFREMFHAAAQMPEFWSDSFGAAYQWKSAANNPKWRAIIRAETPHADLNWAVKELLRTGWIHHLARHIIADYVTRGKLQIHWKFGAELFKNELIDHDLAVNRGNWMWLSGVAFSSKQRSFYHYNYDEYLSKLEAKVAN